MGNRNYLNIGETLHLTSAVMKPTRLDVEYLYYSYMYYNNSKPNYGIGILSIFHTCFENETIIWSKLYF